MKKHIDWCNKQEAKLFAKKYLGVSLYWWILVPTILIGVAVGIPLYHDIWGSK